VIAVITQHGENDETQNVVSREYKVMLKKERFVGSQNDLLERAKGFWRVFEDAIQDIVSGGRIDREYGLGRRTDLLVQWPLDEAQGFHGPAQRAVIELKLLHKPLTAKRASCRPPITWTGSAPSRAIWLSSIAPRKCRGKKRSLPGKSSMGSTRSKCGECDVTLPLVIVAANIGNPSCPARLNFVSGSPVRCLWNLENRWKI